ncbi:MAG: LytR/AlgR family response regulator transcription factor [Saprospiraceae bacterium]|jgi:two-component system LytT family response regulator
MNRISTIIVDDVPLAIKSLEADIQDHLSDKLNIVATATGVVDAAKKIKTHHPQLVLLDIQMQDGDGFDLLDIIDQEEVKVIFTTASREYAVKAFRYSAVDYLLKPVSPDELIAAVSKIFHDEEIEQAKSRKVLPVSTSDRLELVDLDRMIRLEASGNYSVLYLERGEKIVVSKTLKSIEAKLDSRFVRTHQSHIVNLDFIKAFNKTEGGYLVLQDETEIPVSVRKRSQLIDRLKS